VKGLMCSSRSDSMMWNSGSERYDVRDEQAAAIP